MPRHNDCCVLVLSVLGSTDMCGCCLFLFFGVTVGVTTVMSAGLYMGRIKLVVWNLKL